MKLRRSVSARIAELLILRLRAASTVARPLVVALDGRSGSGKSTIAGIVEGTLNSGACAKLISLLPGDDLYAGGRAATWASTSTAGKVEGGIDWRGSGVFWNLCGRMGTPVGAPPTG